LASNRPPSPREARREAPQERVAGQLGGTRQIARAVGLGLGEAEQLARAAPGIRPDPAVQRLQQPIQPGRLDAHVTDASTVLLR
jgi:hypothetical protein